MRRRDNLHGNKNPLLALPHFALMELIHIKVVGWMWLSCQTTKEGFSLLQTQHQGVKFSISRTLQTNVFNYARHKKSSCPQKPHRKTQRRLTGSDCEPSSLRRCSRDCFVCAELKGIRNHIKRKKNKEGHFRLSWQKIQCVFTLFPPALARLQLDKAAPCSLP